MKKCRCSMQKMYFNKLCVKQNALGCPWWKARARHCLLTWHIKFRAWFICWQSFLYSDGGVRVTCHSSDCLFNVKLTAVLHTFCIIFRLWQKKKNNLKLDIEKTMRRHCCYFMLPHRSCRASVVYAVFTAGLSTHLCLNTSVKCWIFSNTGREPCE